MKIEQLYTDFGIIFKTEGHKHCRPGWVNTPCPFCTGHAGYHLGFEIDQEYFYCWRCGLHSVPDSLASLLHVSYKEAFSLISLYEGKSATKTKRYREKDIFAYPSNTSPLSKRHRRYIEERGFDADEIETLFGVLSTGTVSQLDHISYKHRILFPIVWKGEIVSYQARDVTDKQTNKYMACPLHREKIAHQSIVYCVPHLLQETGIVVEGPTDVWRFKKSTVCTFGIDFTSSQVRTISKLFKKVTILFDPEKQAQKQAKKLKKELLFRGLSVKIETLAQDPGSTSQEEADDIVQTILK